MARLALLFLFAAIAIAQDDSDVLELNSESFEDGIFNQPLVLVEFYAPW
jgi:hypothetical protein